MSQRETVCSDLAIAEFVATEVKRVGLVRAAANLHVGREALTRILAGLPVRAGTLALLREGIALRRDAEASPVRTGEGDAS